MLSLAYNWDSALLPRLAGTDVTELYGALPMGAVGSGRPAMAAARRPSRREAARQIRAIRGQGLGFTYLLNATCQDNRESTRRGQRDLHDVLDWCVAAGADAVTVSTPFMASFVHRHHPQLRIQVSMFATANSVERIRHWVDFGATVVTVDPSFNRDLPLIAELARKSHCDLQVIANNACLLGCPHILSHANEISHASQAWHPSGGLYLGYSIVRCRLARLEDPGQILKSDWVRPEDLAVYEAVGIRRFKLVDRLFPTTSLARIARAYTDRSYRGNLLDLLAPNREVGQELLGGRRPGQLLRMARMLFQPSRINPLRLIELQRLLADPGFELDNTLLGGFIEPFVHRSCRDLDCEECGHCGAFAARALRYDREALGRQLRQHREALEILESRRGSSYR